MDETKKRTIVYDAVRVLCWRYDPELERVVVEHVTDANAERDKLIDKYGQKDEAGHLVHGEGNTIQLAFPAEFQASWNELLSASVEIDDKLRLVESDLGDDGSIAANVLIGLGELLGE